MITLENHAVYPEDTQLLSILKDDPDVKETEMVAACVNGIIKDLLESVGKYKTIDWIPLHSLFGARIYRKSVFFLMLTAAHEIFPTMEIVVKFMANEALYCEIFDETEITPETVQILDQHMRRIIAENRDIGIQFMSKEDAVAVFKKNRLIPKANLIESLPLETFHVYYCGEYCDYLYWPLTEKTGGLGEYTLEYSNNGVFLRTAVNGVIPKKVEQTKYQHILTESKRWAHILHCDYIPDLNRKVHQGRIADLIRVSEALHEKSLSVIADKIVASMPQRRVILVAGPSSSGKTSFAQRLKIHLRVNGVEPLSISMDDYYLNRDDTPKLPNGNYDYESIYALDLKLFNEQLVALLAGEEVMLPQYDFITGKQKRDAFGPVSIAPDQPIIIEGIHGLNELLTGSIARENKFKVYVSPFTQLNIDGHNRIHTTDARLIRRMVRDAKYRGRDGENTLRGWTAVRAGEDQNIFPFQEDADALFNTALIYELAVMKKYAEPLLRAVPEDSSEYAHAQLILRFLQRLASLEDETDIPNTSILREFIGGSSFFDEKGVLKDQQMDMDFL